MAQRKNDDSRTDPEMKTTETHLEANELAELRRLARSRPKSGRDRVAKLGALRVIERMAREEAALARREPEFLFPWEAPAIVEKGTVMPVFELYVWSEVEQTLFGHLAGMKGRPAAEDGRIRAVCERLEASADPPAAFRDWFEGVVSAAEAVGD